MRKRLIVIALLALSLMSAMALAQAKATSKTIDAAQTHYFSEEV